MTRINSAIEVKCLTDEHLLAEHREVKRLDAYFRRTFNKSEDFRVPTEFCLGKGHVMFFLNKFKFTYKRYLDLHKECLKRGFHVEDYTDNWCGIPEVFYQDYTPTLTEKRLLIERITRRIIDSPKMYFHYKGDQINKTTAIKLLTKNL